LRVDYIEKVRLYVFIPNRCDNISTGLNEMWQTSTFDCLKAIIYTVEVAQQF